MLAALIAISFAGLGASMLYNAFAALRVARFSGDGKGSTFLPPVTIAKPLYGAEPQLAENLRSFCEQDYPEFEVLFAVRNPEDSAIPIARGLGEVLVQPETFGPNGKMNSLIAVERAARNEILVVSDSDMRAGRGYLRAVVAPFEDPKVGAVTCVYAGRPAIPGPASLLGAMQINEGFLPSVLVALAFQPLDFCFGATMAVRRQALQAIGGFASLAGYLADDYMLGHRVRQCGWKVELAPYIVETTVSEGSFRDLFLHELRWARTIRTVRPAGYAFSILTMSLPWALACLLLTRFSLPACWMAGAAGGLRLLLHAAVRRRLGSAGRAPAWWIPLRDTITLMVYCMSHFGRSIEWKQERFSVSTDGRLHQEQA